MSYLRAPRRPSLKMVGPGSHRKTKLLPAKQQALRRVRYAVVGLGHISQAAVLPAFDNAKSNSQIVALFSDDRTKRHELTARYRIPFAAGYDDYDAFLKNGAVDAVYIAVPNSLHRDFAVRAAKAGVHVLCEKPLAVTEKDCRIMVEACRANRVKLMTAYRLHFEKSNLEAIHLVNSKTIGEPRYFNSIFSMQVSEPNIRLNKKLGGGALYDIGIYCINAARGLFRAEPIEVMAMTASSRDQRFRQVDEMAGAVLRFPKDRIASFICSFGAHDAGNYDVVGTKGRIRIENAYEYVSSIEMEITTDNGIKRRTFERRDQFAPELIYFSDCILRNRQPEPSGMEGLLDVRIIEALSRSAKTGKPVRMPAANKSQRPSLRLEIRRPPVKKPKLIRVKASSR